MKLGITGHQRLADETKWPRIEHAIREFVTACRPAPADPLHGFTNLAIGADQLFARVVLECGGQLHAIIPFIGYERTFTDPLHLASFASLLANAAQVEVLQQLTSDQHSFFVAGQRVVDACDVLIAVWDGRPAAGLGGTADVVAYARSFGRPITRLDPGDF